MPIQFKFDFDRAIGAIAYLLEKLGATDKVKLVKLLYIADRSHFLKYGRPITGSRQVAMDKGPLPSQCLDLLNGELEEHSAAAFRVIHVDDFSVMLRDLSASQQIDVSDREILDSVICSFGSAPKWDLVNHTHNFEEYKAVYRKGTSTTITYESILQHYSNEDRFRHGKPVASLEMQKHMTYSFTAKSDADL